MTGRTSRWMMLIPLALAAGLAGCGSSSPATSSSTAATPTPAPTPTAAATTAQCPSGSAVGSALSTTLPDAVVIPNTGTSQLPSGATGISCNYHAATYNVIITVLQNVSASDISQFSQHFPVAFKPVSGVGDQARSFFEPLGNGKNNEGLVAAKGSTVVAIVATYTPATLSQLESLVNSLL